MPSVGPEIDAYGLTKFLGLSSRQQNSYLYGKLNCKTDKDRDNIRSQKSQYLAKKIVKSDKIHKKKRGPKPHKNQPTHSSNSAGRQGEPPSRGGYGTSSTDLTQKPSNPNDAAGGGDLKLTEEKIEKAITESLTKDPTPQIINTAITWMDKKKAISTDSEETKQAILAKNILEKKQKELFG
jgi:hypothetical protein